MCVHSVFSVFLASHAAVVLIKGSRGIFSPCIFKVLTSFDVRAALINVGSKSNDKPYRAPLMASD